MNNAYLKIIRPVNLGIIILTQLLLRFCIVEVYLGMSNVAPALGYIDLGLLIAATVMVAAAGNIVNDILDLPADRTNRPGRILVGQKIPEKNAWIFYAALNIASLVIGFYLAIRVGNLMIGFIFPAVAGLLYLYSSKYQKMVLTGNIVIALLSALVIIVPWLFEFFALKNDPIAFVESMKQLPVIQAFVAGYAVFAFFVSLLREIVKDVEDQEGDRKGGYRTLAVVYGIQAAKRWTGALHMVTMILLAVALYLVHREGLMLVFWYLIIAVMALLVYVYYQLSIARSEKDFQFLSNAYKLIMLAGILSMELIYISY